jgi:hypothetical protein
MARLISLPTSYGEAVKTLGGRTTRKVANNTRLVADDGAVAVRLHRTDVVVFFSDGRMLIDTGGWDTVTTRARMRACGLGVYHRRHRLYLVDVEISRAALIAPDGTVTTC